MIHNFGHACVGDAGDPPRELMRGTVCMTKQKWVRVAAMPELRHSGI